MFRSRLPRQSSEDDEEDAIETGSRSMSSEGASSELVLATLVVEFDGATKSNPGVGGSGAVVFEEDFEGEREAVIEAGRFVGHCTNNEAEWIGAVLGIGLATDWPRASHARIVVRGDSELVIKQSKRNILQVITMKLSGCWTLISPADGRRIMCRDNSTKRQTRSQMKH
ncbi:hypothetical protein BC830DRAFT_304867 [Chytriomyces sp. MP71]|nr:hypothetical protein BC830DRAFT_304867 [Chytriomyces sp. MP71]